jgi:Tfp pilus assembly major pilin PilA
MVKELIDGAVVMSTLALVYVSILLHKDEVSKMTQAEMDANDNITNVALSEIAARQHQQRTQQLRQISHRRTGGPPVI